MLPFNEFIFYTSRAGSCPVKVFLDSCHGKAAQKIVWTLKLIREMEYISPEFMKKVHKKEGIWEIRVQYNRIQYRLLGFYDNGRFVMTNGFIKKSMRIPAREIKRAVQRKNDYWER
jgi:phage-related protein